MPHLVIRDAEVLFEQLGRDVRFRPLESSTLYKMYPARPVQLLAGYGRSVRANAAQDIVAACGHDHSVTGEECGLAGAGFTDQLVDGTGRHARPDDPIPHRQRLGIDTPADGAEGRHAGWSVVEERFRGWRLRPRFGALESALHGPRARTIPLRPVSSRLGATVSGDRAKKVTCPPLWDL